MKEKRFIDEYKTAKIYKFKPIAAFN